MNEFLRSKKAVIRTFMREHYTDAKLTELLTHAREGKLAFFSCCCFIGIATADHELRPHAILPIDVRGIHHYARAKELPGAREAEQAYAYLGMGGHRPLAQDQHRIKLLIPMIKAEIRRRNRIAFKENYGSVQTAISRQESAPELLLRR